MTQAHQAHMMGLMKRMVFLLGVALLILAFVTTAMELAARSVMVAEGTKHGALISLFEVFKEITPGLLLRLMNLSGWPTIQPFLNVPGWVLFGIPGLALVIVFHDRDPDVHDPELEDSLFLFDRLAEQAQQDLQSPEKPYMPSDITPADKRYEEDLSDDEIDGEPDVERDYLLPPNAATRHTSKPSDPQEPVKS